MKINSPRENELVLATTNKNKKRELESMLKGLAVKILTLDDFKGCPKVREDKKTFKGNAVKKAIIISRFTKRLALADDSGLEVDSLGGAPGVRSARFAGPGQNDKANIRKLLGLISEKKVPLSQRKARFVCFIAIARNGRLIGTVSATVSGRISLKPFGKLGFGYDPVFYYPPLKKTFGQLSASVKNKISHRYKALRKARKFFLKEL